MGKRLRKLKPDIPGPMDCLQVFGMGETEVEDGGLDYVTRSPTLTELTALLSLGMSYP